MPFQITNPDIETYMKQLYDDGDSVRLEMESLAAERGFPIVGPLCGQHLLQLAQMIGAKHVFELGSGYGYSALHFARAVGEDGLVHCTELDQGNINLAEQFLSRANVWQRITYHKKEATAALQEVGGTWDIIYNDIDKDGYPATIDLAHKHLRPGGLFITDNVLWYGKILPGQGDNTASTNGIIKFTEQLFAHRGFLTSIYPIRDGLTVALKL